LLGCGPAMLEKRKAAAIQLLAGGEHDAFLSSNEKMRLKPEQIINRFANGEAFFGYQMRRLLAAYQIREIRGKSFYSWRALTSIFDQTPEPSDPSPKPLIPGSSCGSTPPGARSGASKNNRGFEYL